MEYAGCTEVHGVARGCKRLHGIPSSLGPLRVPLRPRVWCPLLHCATPPPECSPGACMYAIHLMWSILTTHIKHQCIEPTRPAHVSLSHAPMLPSSNLSICSCACTPCDLRPLCGYLVHWYAQCIHLYGCDMGSGVVYMGAIWALVYCTWILYGQWVTWYGCRRVVG